MEKDIKYSGYTAAPSDYECPDGTLAASINLIPEDGSLRPIQKPKVIKEFNEYSNKVSFIHKTSAYKHYIIQAGNDVQWLDSSDEESNPHPLTSINASHDIFGFNAVGNTLIILTSAGMNYCLWKDGTYINLGTHLPELPVSFGLQGEMIRGEEFQISFDKIKFWNGDIWTEFSDENKAIITEQVLAKVNKFIAENSTNAGKFMFPFFVRYAYRLYDGSLSMHSAPVLMVCSSDLAPQCFCTNLRGYNTSTSINSAKLIIAAMFHQLDYAVGSSALQELKKWSDIVKSVDIFVSKPIYTYDQSGKCTKFINTDYSDCYAICKHTNQKASTDRFPLRYQRSTFSWLYAKTFDPDDLTHPGWRLMLPQRDGDAIKADITGNALFYLLKSINIEDLKTERTIIPINKEYLQSLVAREVMTDDYNSHDLLIPKYSFGYNSRLNLADLKLRLFNGYNASACFSFTDGNVQNNSDASLIDYTVGVEVYYHIKQDGKDIVVSGGAARFGVTTPFLWLFYPNTNAYKAVLRISPYAGTDLYEVNLEPHPTLNGSYYFGDWKGINSDGKIKLDALPVLSNEEYRTVDIPNKIYTSEVNNPFYFPLAGINTVGSGKIFAICSAAKALSQGQFGQFPLYAFTDEGVWAMEISSTGTYSARQPITRDVCVNSDGITQIDSAVLFPTDRGIMLISGSQTQCISDAIKTEHPFDLLSLPCMRKLHDSLPHDAATDKCLPIMPFTDFLQQCRMVYDYTHQRIIVYNPSVTYSYVFSLKSQQWGMLYSNIIDNVNSYPEALAIDSSGNLVDFTISDTDEDGNPQNVSSLYVSRPIKLDMPDNLKTIHAIIQRGDFVKGHVSTVLYGSRDLVNWHLIWSSTDHFLRGFSGTPYKYFRIAGVARLDPRESISGCSIRFTPKLTNQPR